MTQYEKPILIWFVLPPGQRTVLGEILKILCTRYPLHSITHKSVDQTMQIFFSDAFGCPYSLFFLEWSLSLTFYKYSMKSQALSVYCDKQKVSHLPWNEFKILRFDSSKNSHSHWVLYNFNRKHEYNLLCPSVLGKTWLHQRSPNTCLFSYGLP